MDWAIDMTGLIITSGTCCGQEAQSVSDTSGGRSGTRSCWWMVDQICADPVWPPTPECIVLQTLLQLTCMWNANQFCPSRVFPVQRVWCHTESFCSSDSPCISCTAHPDAGSHDEVVHRRPAWEFMCFPYEWYVHTILAVQSARSHITTLVALYYHNCCCCCHCYTGSPVWSYVHLIWFSLRNFSSLFWFKKISHSHRFLTKIISFSECCMFNSKK